MARKISQLPATASVATTDVVPLVTGGITKRATVAQILANAASEAAVADDIAKSAGTTIDRVQGLRGETLSGTVPTDDEAWVKRGSVYVAANAMPKRWIDPRRYGAVLDGVTDDIAAFEAMHAALPSTGAVIYISGKAWLSRTWRINKRIRLLGHGGDLSSAFESGFFVAPGYTALQFDSPGNGLDPSNNSAGSTLEAVDFKSRVLVHESAGGSAAGFGIPPWAAAQSIGVGDCRTKAAGADPSFMFRAISVTANGGKGPATTTASQPAWVLTAGATLTDANGITWRSEKLPVVHATSTAYAVGDRVFAPGDNRYYFECEVAGTSAGTRPSQLAGGNSALGQTIDGTFTDGTVTWRNKCAAAVRQHSSYCKFDKINAVAFTGYVGIIAGGTGIVDAGYTDANFAHWTNVLAQYTGGGLHLTGSDCNGWRLSFYSGILVGVLLPTPNAVVAAGYAGLGGHHIHDASLSGGLIDQCYGQLNSGRMILKNGLSILTVLSTYSEVNDKCLFSAGKTMVMGGSIIVDPASGVVVRIDPETAGRGLREEDTTGTVALWARPTMQDGYSSYAFAAPEGGDVNFFSLKYAGWGVPAGCWGMNHGYQTQNTAYILYSAAAGLGYGAGWMGIPIGQLLGNPGSDTPIFDGRTSGLTDRRLRHGARKQGDTFRSQTDVITLLGDGYRGTPWTAATAVNAEYAPWAFPASIVEPTSNTGKPGEQVWKCTTGGTTHATTEPTWPASPTPGVTTQADGTATWTFLGYRPARVLEQRDDKARGPHYRADQTTTTTTVNQLIDGGAVVNGEDLALPEGAITIVTHVIALKKASTAEGGSIDIRSTWIRDGSAAPTQIGTAAITYNLAGTTLDATTVTHVANGNRIELWGDPESVDTLKWSWFRTQLEGVD